ncbi:MAG: hypothetical protein KatS3mg076_1286 [Candidatus Binatia bacterium]|nr:MAG: hypothetical protein KatS3mg076_1286 [Candidatus Binatia bacterium]
MKPSEALRPGALLSGLRFGDLGSVVKALLETLVRAGDLSDRLAEAALRAVLERERVSSTAMVDIGVSIPHARLEGISSVLLALALAPDAVYQAVAGAPISIVALVLSPPDATGEHLNFLSSLSLLLRSEAVRRELCRAESESQVRAIIRKYEGR